MKILHVISSMNPESGGPCEFIRAMSTDLTSKGGQMSVVTLGYADTDNTTESFPIIFLGKRISPLQFNIRLKSWLKKNVEHFDIIIVHGIWLYHSYITRKAVEWYNKEKKSSKKFFVMPHGMLDPYFQHAGSRKLKALRNYLYWYLIEKNNINMNNGLLFTCKTECDLARKTFSNYHPKAEYIIGLGIKRPPPYTSSMTSEFQKYCQGLFKRNFILFLSRIHEKKGLDILFKAFLNVLKKYHGQGIQVPALVIAGPGIETEYGKSVKAFTESEPLLSSNVFFTGMIKGDIKWGALYGCELFILPSHQENFGIAIVEALACRKPVIISDKVNIWKEIENAGAGIIIKEVSANSIEASIEQWFIYSEKEKEAKSENAELVYKQSFSIETTVDNIMRLPH